MHRVLFFLLIPFLCTGCFQAYSGSDDDLRTVPVTNNPNIVPNHGSGMPMAPSQPMR